MTSRSRPAALALPPTFSATYSLLCLHVFMLLVRLRAEGNDGADLAQILYEGFQDDVELRVHAEGVKVGDFQPCHPALPVHSGGSEVQAVCCSPMASWGWRPPGLIDRCEVNGCDNALPTQVRVSKWLKELEKMFYGACEAYEKARCENGAALQSSAFGTSC
jgi:hypothetical protein